MITVLLLILILLFTYLIYLSNKDTFISNNKNFKDYRLGDVLNGYIHKTNKVLYNQYPITYPNTIAAKYIKNVQNYTEKGNNLTVLYKIIDIKNKPKNGINIHLRMGDIVKDYKNGKYIFHKLLKRNYIYGVQPGVYNKLLKHLKKVTPIREVKLFYGSHKFYNQYSNKYIEEIKDILTNNGFKIIELKSFNPDYDFIEMCKSDIFLQSFGGYSEFISKIVKMNNGKVFFIKDFE